MRAENTIAIKQAIAQLSSRVKSFKQKDSNTWNFRCPVCGDSQKSQSKARGNIYQNSKGNFSVKCFNCGYSSSAQQFLKDYFKDLYDEYRFAVFKDKKIVNTPKKTYIPSNDSFSKKGLIPAINKLEARLYLKSRMIPFELWNLFYWTDKLGTIINNNRLDEKYKISDGKPYLVILVYGWKNGNFDNKKLVEGLQARNLLNDNSPRYIGVKLRDDCGQQMIWGLDRIDKSKTIICVEGIFDACLLDNAIALLTSVKKFNSFDKSQLIYLIDNEPRNKSIISIIENHIKNGNNISLLPEKYLEHGKDINDYIKAGISKKELMHDIYAYSYSGVRAMLEFQNWKKI